MPIRTPPPGSAQAANAQRQGVKIDDLVGPAGKQGQQQQQQAGQAGVRQEERTSTDTSMVQALNRGPK